MAVAVNNNAKVRNAPPCWLPGQMTHSPVSVPPLSPAHVQAKQQLVAVEQRKLALMEARLAGEQQQHAHAQQREDREALYRELGWLDGRLKEATDKEEVEMLRQRKKAVLAMVCAPPPPPPPTFLLPPSVVGPPLFSPHAPSVSSSITLTSGAGDGTLEEEDGHEEEEDGNRVVTALHVGGGNEEEEEVEEEVREMLEGMNAGNEDGLPSLTDAEALAMVGSDEAGGGGKRTRPPRDGAGGPDGRDSPNPNPTKKSTVMLDKARPSGLARPGGCRRSAAAGEPLPAAAAAAASPTRSSRRLAQKAGDGKGKEGVIEV